MPKKFFRHLLGFGEVSDFLGYNALQNFFPTYTMKPNPTCANSHCRRHFVEYQEKLKTQPKVEKKVEEEAVVHEDNIWDILYTLLFYNSFSYST
jgi:ubiquitin-like modifier-activating enzyme 5